MVKQNAEMVEEMYQDGTLEPYIIAALVFFVLVCLILPRCKDCLRSKAEELADEQSTPPSSPREFGSSVSEVGEDSQLSDVLKNILQSQTELAEKLNKLEKSTSEASSARHQDGASSSSSQASPRMAPRAEIPPAVYDKETEEQIQSGITSLLKRLEEHDDIVKTDAATAGSSKPPTIVELSGSTAVVPATQSSGVKGIAQLIAKETVDTRAAMLEHLEKYADKPGWNLAGTKERIAPWYLGRRYKTGRSAAVETRQFISERELDNCHAAQEMMLLAMILDRIIREPGDIINSEATEILCRRLHGLELAFAKVRKMSDWKQPRGQQGQKWRTKVRWELCDQYDIRALDEEELYIPGADEEVKNRLEKKALFNKYLNKATESTAQAEDT